jgi:hypothetical protein
MIENQILQKKNEREWSEIECTKPITSRSRGKTSLGGKSCLTTTKLPFLFLKIEKKSTRNHRQPARRTSDKKFVVAKSNNRKHSVRVMRPLCQRSAKVSRHCVTASAIRRH